MKDSHSNVKNKIVIFTQKNLPATKADRREAV